MTYIIGSACIDVKDKECMTSCPVDCIYEGGRMLYINPEQCIDCGSCMPVCPTNAIYEDNDVPDDQKIFIAINKEFFDGVEAESCHDIDLTDKDHPYVIEYKGAN